MPTVTVIVLNLRVSNFYLISFIENNSFANLKKLTTLDLQSNEIKAIDGSISEDLEDEEFSLDAESPKTSDKNFEIFKKQFILFKKNF